MSMKTVQKIKLSQRGDTIVEVMLSIAIIGMVLGASYTTSTRALRTGRFAQEHTEALKLAESQIEKLKYIASIITSVAVVPPNIFDPTAAGATPFCIDNSPPPFAKIVTGTPAFTTSCMSTFYTSTVTYNKVGDIFTVAVTWTTEGNSGQQGNVQIAYKLHK